ncbi:hypothetical protein ABHA69_03310, partial [Ligilactobacillus ruminis]
SCVIRPKNRQFITSLKERVSLHTFKKDIVLLGILDLQEALQKTPVDLTQKNPDMYGTNKVPSLANITFP